MQIISEVARIEIIIAKTVVILSENKNVHISNSEYLHRFVSENFI